MGDDVSVQSIPPACEVDGCGRAPTLIVELVEMTGAVMDARFVCDEHETEARKAVGARDMAGTSCPMHGGVAR